MENEITTPLINEISEILNIARKMLLERSTMN